MIEFENHPYNDWGEAFHEAILGFCPCGQPERIISVFKEYLQFCDHSVEEQQDIEGWEDGGTRNDLTLLIAYICSKADLTQHGGNVRWSWLTNKGDFWLKKLQEWES